MADYLIATLADRMAEALRDKPIDKRADRLQAYYDAGISLQFVRDDDWREADEMARLEEISRRLTQ